MPRKATPEEAAKVNEILARVTFDGSPYFASNEDWKQACAYVKAFSGYVPNGGGCSSCRFKVHDILREAVGLTVARRPVSESKAAKRIATCHECPVYRKGTDSCGRLIMRCPIAQASCNRRGECLSLWLHCIFEGPILHRNLPSE